MFFYDRDINRFALLRNYFTLFVAVPFHSIVNWPVSFVQDASNNFRSKQGFLEENSKLRSELLEANVRLQRLGFLEQENSQLRTLLGSTKQIKTKFIAAQLITTITGTLGQTIIIDKGKIDGLYVGQPAVDAYGLFGQVVAVETNISKVVPITDTKSAIPVMIVRNGIQAIAVGTGVGYDSYLEIVNIPETMDIKKGDFLVTSGVGQRFPAGYAVGVVSEIKLIPGARFVKVLISPSARVNSSRDILLI